MQLAGWLITNSSNCSYALPTHKYFSMLPWSIILFRYAHICRWLFTMSCSKLSAVCYWMVLFLLYMPPLSTLFMALSSLDRPTSVLSSYYIMHTISTKVVLDVLNVWHCNVYYNSCKVPSKLRSIILTFRFLKKFLYLYIAWVLNIHKFDYVSRPAYLNISILSGKLVTVSSMWVFQ